MMKKRIWVLVFFYLCLSMDYTAFSQPLTAAITVDDFRWTDQNGIPVDMSNRFPGAHLTRFYAPLPVFFQGWESSPREAIVDYQWNFGDGAPVFHGFNAGHVYEIPGTYMVTLTVQDTLGNTDTAVIALEVLERTGTVYYIDSHDGNDSYDGLSQTFTGGTNGPWKTADKAFSEMATGLYQPGDRILFKRGQTFTLSVSEITPGAWPAWGYLFGSYGAGPKPIIQYSGENNTVIVHMYSIGLAHISFVDLDFRFDDYAGHKAGTFFFAQGGGTRNILFLRVDALDAYSNLFVIGQYSEREISSGTFIVHSSIRNTSIDPLNNVTLFAVWGSRVVCLNNTFDLAGNHIGYTAIDKGVIAENSFSRPAFGRTALRICGFQEEGEDWNPELTSNNVQISENFFHGWIDPETTGGAHNGGGDSYNYLLVQLSPNGPWNQIIRDITFERNVVSNGLGMLAIGAAENITVRNNIFISDNSEAPSYVISVVDANKPSKNIKIIGNTLVARNVQYSGNIYEMSGMIRVNSNTTQVPHPFGYTNHQDILLKNNIFYVNGTNSLTRFLCINDIAEVLPQVKSNNNLFYVSDGSDGGTFFQIGDAGASVPTAQYLTFTQWKTQARQDSSSIFVHPEFVNLLGSDGLLSEYGFDADLRLQETSLARNIGALDKKNSYFDFNTSARYTSDGTVDIGAFEYSASTAVPAQAKKETIEAYALSQNYPNPFNPSTVIQFTIPLRTVVSVRIYDLRGREIATLLHEEKSAGSYSLSWNGKNSSGEAVGSGVYFYCLHAGAFTETKKIMLVR